MALRKDMSGGVLLSHSLSAAVPSALKGLTSGFGMGPGVSPSPKPPNVSTHHPKTHRQANPRPNHSAQNSIIQDNGHPVVSWEPHRDANNLSQQFTLNVQC